MTSEKYKVSYQGKEIWQGMANHSDLAKQWARMEAKGHKDTPIEELTAEVIPFELNTDGGNMLGDKPNQDTTEPKKRKSRTDKGIPRKKEEPKKRRTVYHLVTMVESFGSKESLDAAIALLTEKAIAENKVIEGGKSRSIQKRFILK